MKDLRCALFLRRRWVWLEFGVNSALATVFGPGAGNVLNRIVDLDEGKEDGDGVLPISARRCAGLKGLCGLSSISTCSDSRQANKRLQATGLRAALAVLGLTRSAGA